jgi:methionine-rich copper-binding protein CopC
MTVITYTTKTSPARMLSLLNVLPGLLMSVLLFVLPSTSAQAQHSTHTYRYTGNVEVEHLPDHDEVLTALPDTVILRFTDQVALVKLVVKTAEDKLIDVQFRYDPTPNRVFIWPLPALPASAWYSVDWGVIDRANILMSGKFMFAAGPDAQAPSTLIPEDNEAHIMVPDYRLIDLQDYQTIPGPN